MPGQYAPLPNPRSTALDANQEMAEAFDLGSDSDGEQDDETTPLNVATSATPHSASSATAGSLLRDARPPVPPTPGTYDFEREYDFPPPGSPPRPSSRALPNDYGNSNGIVPTSPVERPEHRPSFFRRMMGTILPAKYAPLPTTEQRRIGGGIENDGVFSNVVAKPQVAQVVTSSDGTVHIMPEESSKDAPPTYQEAQADAVPTYWETTVHAPMSLEANGDLIVEDLATGSVALFFLNAFISFFFQFVGFLLTYLMHTTHAAKYGSRAGLGLTLIQYGFYSRMNSDDDADLPSGNGTTPTWGSTGDDGTAPLPNDTAMDRVSPKDWMSALFITLADKPSLSWFLFLTSIVGFYRVKRWEQYIRNPAPPPTPDQLERDRNVRQTLEQVFGIAMLSDQERAAAAAQVEEDERLARDLRSAGLL